MREAPTATWDTRITTSPMGRGREEAGPKATGETTSRTGSIPWAADEVVGEVEEEKEEAVEVTRGALVATWDTSITTNPMGRAKMEADLKATGGTTSRTVSTPWAVVEVVGEVEEGKEEAVEVMQGALRATWDTRITTNPMGRGRKGAGHKATGGTTSRTGSTPWAVVEAVGEDEEEKEEAEAVEAADL